MTNTRISQTLLKNYHDGIRKLSEHVRSMECLWEEYGANVLTMNEFHDLDSACNIVFSNEALREYFGRPDFSNLKERYSAMQICCDKSSASIRDIVPRLKVQDVIWRRIEQDREKLDEDGLSPSDEDLVKIEKMSLR